jgi:2'-5' RNA ligase
MINNYCNMSNPYTRYHSHFDKQAVSAGNIMRILGLGKEEAEYLVNYDREAAFALAKVWKKYGKSSFDSLIDWFKYTVWPRTLVTPDDITNPSNRWIIPILNKMSLKDMPDSWDKLLVGISKYAPMSKIDPSQVVLSFPDGYKWIKISDDQYNEEGRLMGHCGEPSEGGQMYSLRGPNDRPHITVEIKGINKEIEAKIQHSLEVDSQRYNIHAREEDELRTQYRGKIDDWYINYPWAPKDLDEVPPLAREFIHKFINHQIEYEKICAMAAVSRRQLQEQLKSAPIDAYELVQIKGKGNSKPDPKYSAYIRAFYDRFGIEKQAQKQVRDIIVTIPRKDIKKIEAEEQDVATREANGETNINYYWEMGKVPKQQPNRIYFVWDNAIRAYHDVIGMEPNRILMSTKINEVNPPIPMSGFRGYRYFNSDTQSHTASNSKKDIQVEEPYTSLGPPNPELFEKDNEANIVCYSSVDVKYDPYKIGHIYDYNQLLEEHQREINVNWVDKDGKYTGQNYLWLRTVMPTVDLIKESQKWYDKNWKTKWNLDDHDKVIKLAQYIEDGKTIRPLLVSPLGERDGGLWEGYHRLRSFDMLAYQQVPVIVKINLKDRHWKTKISQFKDRLPWICIDLDGTILDEVPHKDKGRPPLGEPFPGVKEVIDDLAKMAGRISIWTARQYFESNDKSDWEKEIADILNNHNIYFDDIYVGKKPPADVFIDDRAVPIINGDWSNVISQVKDILQRHKKSSWSKPIDLDAVLKSIDHDSMEQEYTDADEARQERPIDRDPSTEHMLRASFDKQAVSAGNIMRILGLSKEEAEYLVNYDREAAFALAKLWKKYWRTLGKPISSWPTMSEMPNYIVNNRYTISILNKMNLKDIPDELGELYELLEKQQPVSKIDPSQVVLAFPDGYKWIKISGEQCGEEGRLMSHCGTSSGGQMYSLRDPNGRPHITVEIKGTNKEIEARLEELGLAYEKEYKHKENEFNNEFKQLVDQYSGKIDDSVLQLPQDYVSNCQPGTLEYEYIQKWLKINDSIDEYRIQYNKQIDNDAEFQNLLKPCDQLGMPIDAYKLVQIKGKGNSKPDPKYSAYIRAFYDRFGIERQAQKNKQNKFVQEIFESVGEASLCWDPKPAGEFDTAKATEVAEKLIKIINASEHKGTFIGLRIPFEVAAKIAIDDGESPDDLHVTIFYSKELTKDQQTKLEHIWHNVWDHNPKCHIKLGGLGRFIGSESSDGKDVIYASVDSPELQALRDAFVQLLNEENIEHDKTHGYSPHVTLKYIDSDEDFKLNFDPVEFDVVDYIINLGTPTDCISLSSDVNIVEEPEQKSPQDHQETTDPAHYPQDEQPDSINLFPEIDFGKMRRVEGYVMSSKIDKIARLHGNKRIGPPAFYNNITDQIVITPGFHDYEALVQQIHPEFDCVNNDAWQWFTNTDEGKQWQDGFVDNDTNRFLTRQQAAKIIEEDDHIKVRDCMSDDGDTQLTSEELQDIKNTLAFDDDTNKQADIGQSLNDLTNDDLPDQISKGIDERNRWNESYESENYFEDKDIHLGSIQNPYTRYHSHFDKQAVSAGNIMRILGLSKEEAEYLVNYDREAAFALAKLWKKYGLKNDNISEWLGRYGANYICQERYMIPLLNKMHLKDMPDTGDELFDQLEKQQSVSKINPGQVVLSFPDGYKWIKISGDQCKEEGRLMSHCGEPSEGGQMYSLRDPNGRPHVTVEIVGINKEIETKIFDLNKILANKRAEYVGKLELIRDQYRDKIAEYYIEHPWEPIDRQVASPLTVEFITKMLNVRDIYKNFCDNVILQDRQLQEQLKLAPIDYYKLVQIRGKGNSKPDPKYSAYIRAFYDKFGIETNLS